MAVSVVSSVVGRLGALLVEEAKFLYGVEDKVLDLQMELVQMQCFLEDADAIRYKNKRVRNWIAEIRELAYVSEDVLETFVFKVASKMRRGSFYNIIRRYACIMNEGVTLHQVRSEIETIKIKISKLSAMLRTYGIRDLSPSAEGSGSAREKQLLLRQSYSHVIEDHFVGFQEDISKLVAELVGENRRFRALSICGMGGLGKTTLAKKVYHHEEVRGHFEAFAWSCISQQMKKEDVVRGILTDLMPENGSKDIANMTYEGQVERLFKIQEEKKCLVVLDDLWYADDWNIISPAFPNRNTGSKILLTSRFQEVVAHIDTEAPAPHKPELLGEEESWELFHKKAFQRGDDTDSTINQKMELGREMVKHCRGLPLAIVVLGGLLVRKHQLNEWQTVHQNIASYLMRDKIHGEQGMGVSEILALSYHDLPYWLKPCFLFLANYPEDVEIETESLYQLWVAEGFISVEEEERGEEETMMEVAERYLGELAQRCMVQVQIEDDDEFFSTTSGYRRYKSCRLHDLMREMCLSMVKEENFLKIVDFRHRSEQQHYSCSSSSSPFLATSSTHSNKIHRLAMYLDGVLDEDTNRDLCFDQGKSIRSVLFFYRGKRIDVSSEQVISHLSKNFKLARVLDLQGLIFSSVRETALPKAIGNLIHLRYLSLRYATFNELPSSVGNLIYLETLDLRVDCSLTVPNVLWKLERLRHLYFRDAGFLKTNGKLQLDGLNNLETLENFNVECCNVNDLHKLTNLQKLIVARIDPQKRQESMEITSYLMSVTQKRLRLRYFSVYTEGLNFCSEEEELTLLRQLLLECHHLNVHKVHRSGLIRKLPEFQQCNSSSSLTHLILRSSKLTEDPLARLEKLLPNLIHLSLNNAFVGKEMVSTADGFPRLKYLNLVWLNNLEVWKVNERAMTSLSTLRIAYCTKLKMVPDGLRFVTGLQKLEFMGMPLEFINRLRVLDGKEGDDFDKVHRVPSITLGVVFP